MTKEQLHRVLIYVGKTLIEVKPDQTRDEALALIQEWTDDDLNRHVKCEPLLNMQWKGIEPGQDNKVLPTPMSLYSFDTSIGEILIASDDEITAVMYVSSILKEYANIVGESVKVPNPDNVSPVHAVFLSGQSLTDYLDPAELAEFDHPGITTE